MINIELENQVKSKLLNILRYTTSFFEKNGLNYYMACGSALGAVRHKGIIPWDDDIDIYMPREDYNRLLSLRKLFDNHDFGIIAPGDDNNYYLGWIKIEDKKSTLWEIKEFPCIMGISIDIFPLDLTPDGMQRIAKKWFRLRSLYTTYRDSLARYSFGDMIRMLVHKQYGILFKSMYNRISAKRQKEIKRSYFDYEKSLNSANGFHYVSYTENGMYVFEKEWYDGYIMIPFEDFEVRLCKGYDSYLKYLYGDYMTLPPVEKRQSEHHRYYINIKERIGYNEIVKRVKSGIISE